MHRYVQLIRNTLLAVVMASLSAMAMAADKHYNITSPDGVTIAVQESGDPSGPAIVFIHGLLGSRLNWEKQPPAPRCSATA